MPARARPLHQQVLVFGSGICILNFDERACVESARDLRLVQGRTGVRKRLHWCHTLAVNLIVLRKGGSRVRFDRLVGFMA